MTLSAAFLDRIGGIVGPLGLTTDQHAIAPHLIEERGLYRGSCGALIRPASTAETAAVVRACAEAGVAMVPQGGNTGLCGGGTPFDDGHVLLSMERMTRIRSIDPLDFTMTVEAGCILATVQAAAEAVDRLFPLSLAAEGSCRIGGNISTNAGGVGVLRYGNTRDLVLGLEVVLPDGRVWDGLRALRKDNTGYDLKHLFIGAEGTLGIVTAAVLKLYPRPRRIETAVAAIADPDAALEILARARAVSGDAVTACELIPRIGLEMVCAHIPGARDPFGGPHPHYLLLEMSSGRDDGALRRGLETLLTSAIEDGVAADAVVAESLDQRRALWRLRESLPEAQKHEGGSIKHDVAVAVSRVPDFIRRATLAVEREMPGIRVVAFGHIGDGNIHFNLSQPVRMSKEAFLAEWGRFNRIVHDIIADMNGSISAEHGIGRLKKDELVRYKSAVEIDLMRRVKAALDPSGLMNPGKIL